MRKDFGKKMLMSAYPVLIIGTYDEFGNANAMNAAWGGQTDYNLVSIALSNHKTTKNLSVNKEFTLSFGTKKTEKICDYFGMVSGEKEDKIKKSGVHVEKAKYVNAPLILEFPFTLECKVVSYENEVLIGEVINLSIDDSILDKDGNISLELMEPILYDGITHTYRVLGDIAGFAFKDGKLV